MPAIRAYDKWPRPVGGDENELTITDLVLAVVMAPAPPSHALWSPDLGASVFALSFCSPNDFLRLI